MEKIFADRLFTGMLRGTELHAPMGERTRQEEILIAVDVFGKERRRETDQQMATKFTSER